MVAGPERRLDRAALSTIKKLAILVERAWLPAPASSRRESGQVGCPGARNPLVQPRWTGPKSQFWLETECLRTCYRHRYAINLTPFWPFQGSLARRFDTSSSGSLVRLAIGLTARPIGVITDQTVSRVSHRAIRTGPTPGPGFKSRDWHFARLSRLRLRPGPKVRRIQGFRIGLVRTTKKPALRPVG